MAREKIERVELEYYGYQHINGTLHVRRLFSKRDILEAKQSPFCTYVSEPFKARSKWQAKLELYKRISNQ